MTAKFADLLTPQASGVYLAPPDLAALRQAVDDAGLAWFGVDLAHVADKNSLLVACSRDLGFPQTFGGNWDALADCLQDFSWRDAPGYVINLTQVAAMARAAPQEFQLLLDILMDAATYWEKRGSVFMALVDHQTGGLAGL
ncbi:MAG: barstar family protein [Burkholderiales bacterium]|nr:barstar family protein [Burkholderiales bacterium]